MVVRISPLESPPLPPPRVPLPNETIQAAWLDNSLSFFWHINASAASLTYWQTQAPRCEGVRTTVMQRTPFFTIVTSNTHSLKKQVLLGQAVHHLCLKYAPPKKQQSVETRLDLTLFFSFFSPLIVPHIGTVKRLVRVPKREDSVRGAASTGSVPVAQRLEALSRVTGFQRRYLH